MDRQIEEIDRIMLWRGKGTENEKGGDGEISCINRIFLNFFFLLFRNGATSTSYNTSGGVNLLT